MLSLQLLTISETQFDILLTILSWFPPPMLDQLSYILLLESPFSNVETHVRYFTDQKVFIIVSYFDFLENDDSIVMNVGICVYKCVFEST